jgi:hypothetical protein
MFALGKPSPLTARQKHKRRIEAIRKKLEEKKPNRIRIFRRPYSDDLPKKYRHWNILPSHRFQNYGAFFLLGWYAPSFRSRWTELQTLKYPFPGREIPSKFLAHWDIMYAELLEKYALNMKVRWAMKRLVNAFLAKRIQQKNEVDPVTLEVPTKSIALVDLPNRAKYIFEASSLLYDFHTRLLSHEELFPMPLQLRNPLTNQVLTYSQQYSMYNQLRSRGEMIWSLECLRDARFDLYLFTRDNNRKLKLSALRDTLQSRDGVYTLLDFIESQHDYYDMRFDALTYRWALSNRQVKSHRLDCWKSACLEYYTIDITNDDCDEKEKRWKVLRLEIKPLCEPIHELLQMRRMLNTAK